MEIHDAGLTFNGTAPSAGKQKIIDAIVVHHRAGSGDVQSIHKQHLAQGWWGIGYHYYIRKDGTIWRGRPEIYVGSHAGASSGYNTHSIGICWEGNFETEQMTDAQLAAGRELIADIKSRHPIKEVLRHSDVAATVCPGKNFRWAELLEIQSSATPDVVTAAAGKPVTVKVGAAAVEGLLIDNTTYVPLRAILSAVCNRLVVTWSAEAGAAVELK